MDLTPYRHVDGVVVACPPADVYALVADVTRMGEWSPVCTGADWDPDGRWFTGHNAIGEFTWDTRCRVDVADPPTAFRFVNCGPNGDLELVRWGFELTPVDGGTQLRQTWEVLPDYEAFVLADAPDADVAARLDGMRAMAETGMAETLAKVKAAAEGT